MVGPAFEEQLGPAYAHDVGHGAYGQAFAFQHGALLYVQLHKARETVLAAVGFGQCFGARAQALQGLTQGVALAVAGGQHVGAELAGHGTAAHAGNAVVAGFLAEKVYDFERVLQRDVGVVQCVSDFEPSQHAQDAVKASAGIHGVGMRARGQGLELVAPARAAANQVAGGIQAYLQAGGFKGSAQPGASGGVLGAEGAARPGHIGPGEGGQVFEAAPQACTVNGRELRAFGSIHGLIFACVSPQENI